VNPFSTRIKLLGATGILAASLGVASLGGAFAGHAGVAQAASPVATATATSSAPGGPGPFGRGPGGPGPGGPGRDGRGFGPGPGGGAGSLDALATYLGVSSTDLQTALHGGQTLAQVAQAHGKSTADLKTFLTSQLKTRLDQQVASGKLTSQQETDQLNAASTRIDQQINGTFPAGGPRGPGGPKGFGGDQSLFQTAATTLGMNVSDVQTELQAGKTLTQIAQEHGKTAADIKTALLNAYSTQIDKLLATNFQQLRSQRPTPTAGTSAPATTPTATPTA